LTTGTYQGEANALWKDFRREWQEKIAPGMGYGTRELTINALSHFERLVNPIKTHFIAARHVDHYIAKRRTERGRRRGSVVSPATVNKELRHIRAALNIAKDWGYLPIVPRFRMLREPGRLPRYVTGDHFAAIYAARSPDDIPNVTPADWWRALLVVAYMTGWRIDVA